MSFPGWLRMDGSVIILKEKSSVVGQPSQSISFGQAPMCWTVIFKASSPPRVFIRKAARVVLPAPLEVLVMEIIRTGLPPCLSCLRQTCP